MDMNSLAQYGASQKISVWKKPGGPLGMILLGCVGIYALFHINTILTFLISLTTNIITLIGLVAAIVLIVFLATDKKFRNIVSLFYLTLMSKIEGCIIDNDPVAVVEAQIIKLEKKKKEICDNMGKLKGVIVENKRDLNEDKKNLEREMQLCIQLKEDNALDELMVHNNQVVRLKNAVQNSIERITQSEKWYDILCKLEKAANLTILDIRNEVTAKKKEYNAIKKQYNAFSSVMSIINGNPDEMALLNKGMESMTIDITNKLGAMEHVISETGGILAEIRADNNLANKKADEFIKRYEQYGIEGIFNGFKDPDSQSSDNLLQNTSTPISGTIKTKDIDYVDVPMSNQKKLGKRSYF